LNARFIYEDGKPKGASVVVHDVTEQKQMEKALRKREKELEINNEKLEEINTALRVLLKKRDEDKREVEDKVLLNMKELIIPLLTKLENAGISARQKSYTSVIKSNLNDIISPFVKDLSSLYWELTPKEIQVANLVKEGKTTKEIADFLNSSIRVVEFHRGNLRNKLGLKNKKANLRSFLLTIS